ncbi:hypothetical protein FPZ49_30905 [Paenibacillus cremeus]|uniref:Uncharacterized protein n=1 Tax=Paenibacillus cremeus TaxID=2163881 RepID=A0A559JVU6_9BACL|nr:hypothetical protein FPZ49_30905 [Paenibacillus cremeus]
MRLVGNEIMRSHQVGANCAKVQQAAQDTDCCLFLMMLCTVSIPVDGLFSVLQKNKRLSSMEVRNGSKALLSHHPGGRSTMKFKSQARQNQLIEKITAQHLVVGIRHRQTQVLLHKRHKSFYINILYSYNPTKRVCFKKQQNSGRLLPPLFPYF